jgi:hypothetical protein
VISSETPSLGARLEAAAISLKMIAARNSDITPYVATMAERFSLDEGRLRRAVRTFDPADVRPDPLEQADDRPLTPGACPSGTLGRTV